MHKTAIVIGAGIVGLAAARALALRGWQVQVMETNEKAVGASIRNFGMIWPVGQPDGELYERAKLSRGIWKEVCDSARIWYEESGSLHLAYHPDEWGVMQELATIYKHRDWRLLSPEETLAKSPFAVAEGLLGALYSPDEMIVDPRVAVQSVAAWLADQCKVTFVTGRTVTRIEYPFVFTGREKFRADKLIICSGANFETLYPDIFSKQPLTKCKLQMMRLSEPVSGWRIGPPVCGGLSLIHYSSFREAPSLGILRKRYEEQYPDHIRSGIHVMVSQNQAGELTVGDSHEYGITPDPFDRQPINRLILDYLGKFVRFPGSTVIESWNGVYPKMTNNQADLVLEVEEGVTIINGLGGAGMTLSFGLCEQVVSRY